MAKGLYEAVLELVAAAIEQIDDLEVIEVERRSVKKDDGSIEDSVKYTCEIGRGFDALSRKRIDIKIPGTTMKVTPEQLEEAEYRVGKIDGLTLSYLDSSRKAVYFKATDISVRRV